MEENNNNKRKREIDDYPRIPSPMRPNLTMLHIPKRIKISTIYEEDEDKLDDKKEIKITVEDCKKNELKSNLDDNFNIFDLIKIHKNYIRCDLYTINFTQDCLPIICSKLSCAIQFINNYYLFTDIDKDLYDSLFNSKIDFDVSLNMDHEKLCKLYEIHCEETPLRYMKQETFNKDINFNKENHLQNIVNDLSFDDTISTELFNYFEPIKIKWYSDSCHDPEHWSKQKIYVKTNSETFPHINSLMKKYVNMKSRIGILPGFELDKNNTFIIYPFSTIDIAGLIKEDLTNFIFSTKPV